MSILERAYHFFFLNNRRGLEELKQANKKFARQLRKVVTVQGFLLVKGSTLDLHHCPVPSHDDERDFITPFTKAGHAQRKVFSVVLCSSFSEELLSSSFQYRLQACSSSLFLSRLNLGQISCPLLSPQRFAGWPNHAWFSWKYFRLELFKMDRRELRHKITAIRL